MAQTSHKEEEIPGSTLCRTNTTTPIAPTLEGDHSNHAARNIAVIPFRIRSLDFTISAPLIWVSLHHTLQLQKQKIPYTRGIIQKVVVKGQFGARTDF